LKQLLEELCLPENKGGEKRKKGASERRLPKTSAQSKEKLYQMQANDRGSS